MSIGATCRMLPFSKIHARKFIKICRNLCKSTKIHEKEEPLFKANICKQMISNMPTLSCEILLFSEYNDRFNIKDNSEMINCEQTSSEIEYSKSGHYVVIIRKNN